MLVLRAVLEFRPLVVMLGSEVMSLSTCCSAGKPLNDVLIDEERRTGEDGVCCCCGLKSEQ